METARPHTKFLTDPSMPGAATNCSMAKSSTRSPWRRSSSRVGAATTTPCARMDRSDTSHRRQRSSCRQWPHGRLRNPVQLRRPCWRRGRLCINIPNGPLSGGRSLLTMLYRSTDCLCQRGVRPEVYKTFSKSSIFRPPRSFFIQEINVKCAQL
jgi:hypothetical protein